MTLTDDDAKGRALFKKWCDGAGLSMGVDQMGTMFMRREGTDPDALPELSIATDKVCFVALKARQFDVKDAMSDPDTGSNPTDDAVVDVLEVVVAATPVVVGVWVTWSVAETPTAPPPQRTPML